VAGFFSTWVKKLNEQTSHESQARPQNASLHTNSAATLIYDWSIMQFQSNKRQQKTVVRVWEWWWWWRKGKIVFIRDRMCDFFSKSLLYMRVYIEGFCVMWQIDVVKSALLQKTFNLILWEEKYLRIINDNGKKDKFIGFTDLSINIQIRNSQIDYFFKIQITYLWMVRQQ